MRRKVLLSTLVFPVLLGKGLVFVQQLPGCDLDAKEEQCPSVSVLPVYSMRKGQDFFFRIDFQNTGKTPIRYVDLNSEVGFLQFPLYRNGKLVPYAYSRPQVTLHESLIRELKPGENVAHNLSIARYKRLSEGRYELRFRYFTYKSRFGFTPIDIAETPIAWIEVR